MADYDASASVGSKSSPANETDAPNRQDVSEHKPRILSARFGVSRESSKFLCNDLCVRQSGVVYFDGTADSPVVKEHGEIVEVDLETGSGCIMQCAKFPIANIGKKKSNGVGTGNLRNQKCHQQGNRITFSFDNIINKYAFYLETS